MDLTKIYTSIEDLPLYNFDKIDTTKDLMWLYEDFNGRQSKVDTKELELVYESIFNQYFEALEDRSIIIKIQKQVRKNNLALKYNVVLGLVQRISLGFEVTDEGQHTRYLFIENLKKWGYTIPEMNSYENDLQECQRIVQRLESVKTQMILIDNELKKGEVSESISLQKQLIIASQVLQLGYAIKPKETTVREWIEMLKLLQETQKAN